MPSKGGPMPLPRDPAYDLGRLEAGPSGPETYHREVEFSGAAAGLLNAGIIARELVLADKTELSGKDRPDRDGGSDPMRPSGDDLADMREHFLGGLIMKHAPEVAAKLAAETGQRLPEHTHKRANGAASPFDASLTTRRSSSTTGGGEDAA